MIMVACNVKASVMFTAASCGLNLLCDEALRQDLACAEMLDPPSPSERRALRRGTYTGARVHFSEIDTEVMLDHGVMQDYTNLEREASLLADLLIPRCTEDESRYDRWLETALQQAEINQKKNAKVFRYGEPSPITHKKQRTDKLGDGALHPDSTQVGGSRSATEAEIEDLADACVPGANCDGCDKLCAVAFARQAVAQPQGDHP